MGDMEGNEGDSNAIGALTESNQAQAETLKVMEKIAKDETASLKKALARFRKAAILAKEAAKHYEVAAKEVEDELRTKKAQ
jgi:hypothetical protein